MKERFIAVGLGVSAALTLSIGWTDSAQAFSLGSSVSAINSIKTVSTPVEIIFFDESEPKEVGPGLELPQFGGIWDIDLSKNAVLFNLNSRFGNVVSGDDVYTLKALTFGGPGQSAATDFSVTYLGDRAFNQNPVFDLIGGDTLEVVFPLGFAQNLTLIPQGELAFRVDLTVEQIPSASIPTPALLPGLVGMGLAALRQQRKANNQAD